VKILDIEEMKKPSPTLTTSDLFALYPGKPVMVFSDRLKETHEVTKLDIHYSGDEITICIP
jgi:hypothetical protein